MPGEVLAEYQWFWGGYQVGETRATLIIRAEDKKHALGQVALFCAEYPKLGLTSEDPDKVFEPNITPMEQESIDHFTRMCVAQNRPVVLHRMYEPPLPPLDPTTAVGYRPLQ